MITTFVISTKGGVGKTVTAGNLSAYLAMKGYRVLAIDVDPQASLTIFLCIDKDVINERGVLNAYRRPITARDILLASCPCIS